MRSWDLYLVQFLLCTIPRKFLPNWVFERRLLEGICPCCELTPSLSSRPSISHTFPYQVPQLVAQSTTTGNFSPSPHTPLGPSFVCPLYSVQFSSVTQSCPTLCDPMNRSTPGLPVHYQLPEFTQTHVHQVSNAIQPSHPLSSPSPAAPNPSQHQSLFQ